jgi:hypothetical protein
VNPKDPHHDCVRCRAHPEPAEPEERPFKYAWIVAAGVVLLALLLLLVIRG